MHPSVCPRLIPFACLWACCSKAQGFNGAAVQGRPRCLCPVLAAPLMQAGRARQMLQQCHHLTQCQPAAGSTDGPSCCSMTALQPSHGSGMPAAPPWPVSAPPSSLAPHASSGEGSWGAPRAAWLAVRRGCRRLMVLAQHVSLTSLSTCDGCALCGVSWGRILRRLLSTHLLCLWATLSS